MCVICEKEIEKRYTENGDMYWEFGDNAEPVASGQCCGKCHEEKVFPARLKMHGLA